VNIPTVAFLVALILALIDEARARGESLVAWAVIAIAVGLLWGVLR
jgi:hypothetical protein